jgi:hypothetical protein
MISYEYCLPQFLIPAIEYGTEGTEGFEDEDRDSFIRLQNDVKDLMVFHNSKSHTWAYEGEPYFSYSPDFCNKGCTVCNATLTIW